MNKRLLLAFCCGMGLLVSPTLGAFNLFQPYHNAETPAENAAKRRIWLSSAAQYLVNFETGFFDGQNVDGGAGLFPGGLVISHSSGTRDAKVTSSSIELGGSNPVGSFALSTHSSQLRFDFAGAGVDYFGFKGIGHGSMTLSITLRDDSTHITVPAWPEETALTGDSAEFFGIRIVGYPPIQSVVFNTTGDFNLGLDDLEYGVVPEPAICSMVVGLAALLTRVRQHIR